MSTDEHDVGYCQACEYHTTDWTTCDHCKTVFCCGCAEHEMTWQDDFKFCKDCVADMIVEMRENYEQS